MKQPTVHPNDADPERALASEYKRLDVVNREVNRIQLDIEALRFQQTGYNQRAKVITAEIKRLEKLIKKREKP
jgi:hypothetical protein